MTNSNYTGTATDFYVASNDTAQMVNLAIALEKPLLVEGEAGCGKTKLAESIAAELNIADLVKISVKSTTQAKDLLYRFDALRRLQDAQDKNNKTAKHIYPYLSLGKLGAAMQQNRRVVILLDEVDKADIDFPNDLLDVLDQFEFQIPELPSNEENKCLQAKGFGSNVRANNKFKPIIIITSNREKRLPEAFLRRCLYIRLQFPDSTEQLIDIIQKNCKNGSYELSDEIIASAVKSFCKIRNNAVAGNAQKPPSTSELIDWINILHLSDNSNGDIKKNIDTNDEQPPFWETLFKTYYDQQNYPSMVGLHG